MEITEENIKLSLMLVGFIMFLKSIGFIFNLIVICAGLYTFVEIVFPQGIEHLEFLKNEIEQALPGTFKE